jgi:hypothetical protein
MNKRRLVGFLRDCAISGAVAIGILVLCEIVLRLFAPQLPRLESREPVAVADDVLGYRYRPNSTAHHITPEFSVEYAIDEQGLRKRSEPLPADSSAMRILVVGDSFTFGDGNKEDDIWVRVAERALREPAGRARGVGVEFVNAGIEGFDTRSELYLLKELAPKVRPAAVVLAFVANDVYTNQPATSPPPKPPSGKRGGVFSLHIVAWAKRMAMQNDRLYARLFLLTARRAYYATAPDAHVTRQIEITRNLIGEMAAYCRERGIQLFVVSIPQEFAVISTAHDFHFDGVNPQVIDQQLAPSARESGCVWIEALPRLAAVYRDWHRNLFYRVDGHLTPEGNRVLGELVAATLMPSAWGARPH